MKYQVKSVEMKRINRLKVILVEKQKTGKWLAGQLGKDPATVSRWCSNAIQPSVEIFTKITELLNGSIIHYKYDLETKTIVLK